MKGLFWGLLTIDLHFFTDYYPEENSKTKVKKFDSYVGGPATNAAITFGHLGGKTRLITAIGQNAFNSMIKKDISNFNIELIDLIENKKTAPVFASILTNESNGSRTILSYHPEQVPPLNPGKYLSDIDIALFDGFYIEPAIEMARECRARGITTVLEGGSWKNKTDQLLEFIDIAICSEDFLPPGTSHPADVTEFLLKCGVGKTAITRGEKPIIVNEGEANMLLEVPQSDVVDTLGAGDILHGAFCYFYAEQNNFMHALRNATQIASFSCEFHGPRAWMEQV